MQEKPWDKAVVYVIDDDADVGKAIARLLAAAGYQYEIFVNAQQFLDAALKQADACCALLDIRMPGDMDGMGLQKHMQEHMPDVPIVFITGHGDLDNSVQAFRNGAVHFLTKPFKEEQLLAAIDEALLKNYDLSATTKMLERAREGFERLTAREREVFFGVVRGLLNKIIADQTGISETTVKVHRARVMDKMQANSVAQMVRMAMLLAEDGVFSPEAIKIP